MTTTTIQHQAAKRVVLEAYRQLRRAGLSPHDTMAQLCDAYAHQIALAVSRGAWPHEDTIERWTAANAYANSMTRRPLWWWRTR